MDIQLKEMLLTLHNSCHADIHTLMKQFTREIYSLGDRVPTIKESMGEMTTTINDLVEANDKNIEEHAWLKAKIADLEDRTRRNNLKLRDIPEVIQPPDLKKYVTDLFPILLPEAPAIELTIDRIHRIPKPTFLPQ